MFYEEREALNLHWKSKQIDYCVRFLRSMKVSLCIFINIFELNGEYKLIYHM